MRADGTYLRWLLGVGLLGLSVAALPGCGTGEKTDPDRAEAELEEEPEEELGGDAARMAEELARAMEGADLEGASPGDFELNEHPDWRRGRPTEPEADEQPEAGPGLAVDGDVLFRPWLFPGLMRAGDPEPRPELLSDAELVRELHRRLYYQDDTPLGRAVRSVGLGLVRQNAELAPALLEPLSERQREQLERYAALLHAAQQQMIERDARPDRQAIEDRLHELFADEPLSIDRLVLARRVNGFGIYEAFEQYRFLSGQDNRMIVYVELENFTTRESGGQFEVELQQEVSLYNASDGLRVWREDPVTIVDRSRNRRRDFFVVQMITLPERLSVGEYYLNVRVSDEHGQSLDEATTQIQIVAEENLLAGDK